MKLPSPLTGYIADVRDSAGRRRALLIAGGILVAAMASYDVYTVASGAVPILDAVVMLSIALSVGRSASRAYRRRYLKR